MREYFKNKWLYYVGGLLILIILLFEARGTGDFYIFISASKDLMLGKNIYDIHYLYNHYYYNLIFALILAPFTYLPFYVVKLMWLILNVFFVYRIWKIISGWLPVAILQKKVKIIFIILSFVFIISFLRDNFHAAQLTIFILYLALEGLHLINKNKIIAGSLLIALGIDIKLLPILLIPYLLYRKEWKSTLLIVLFIIVLLMLPIAFIGFDYTKFLLTQRWLLINPMNHEHILDISERKFGSLTSLLSTLLVTDCISNNGLTLKRNIADISFENLNIIINIVRGAFMLFTLYFLRTMPFKKINLNIQKLYEISYICLIIPLIFPHQQYYAFFFIFPASTYLLFYLVYFYFHKEENQNCKYFKFKKITLITMLSISFFLTNSRFLLGVFSDYYDHYKTLTYGVLLLVILLAIYKPDKLLIENKTVVK
jgi:hypothetical protein